MATFMRRNNNLLFQSKRVQELGDPSSAPTRWLIKMNVKSHQESVDGRGAIFLNSSRKVEIWNLFFFRSGGRCIQARESMRNFHTRRASAPSQRRKTFWAWDVALHARFPCTEWLCHLPAPILSEQKSAFNLLEQFHKVWNCLLMVSVKRRISMLSSTIRSCTCVVFFISDWQFQRQFNSGDNGLGWTWMVLPRFMQGWASLFVEVWLLTAPSIYGANAVFRRGWPCLSVYDSWACFLFLEAHEKWAMVSNTVIHNFDSKLQQNSLSWRFPKNCRKWSASIQLRGKHYPSDGDSWQILRSNAKLLMSGQNTTVRYS